jgi:hypothetical protein
VGESESRSRIVGHVGKDVEYVEDSFPSLGVSIAMMGSRDQKPERRHIDQEAMEVAELKVV